MLRTATLLGALASSAFADMYIAFPGGSNNRLSEEQREVQNQNRLFDSQNNNRFGYNQAGHAFYTGSEIDLQWTIQHGCGEDSNVKCEVVMQYACHENLRDGKITKTIPKNRQECKNQDCNTDDDFGMHEPYEDYQHCALRERDYNLFPADRNINGKNARFTRQENNGDRYGYECNEERDYYPYWHPTIWKDIAVWTDDEERCDLYKEQSENVKGRWHCHVPKKMLDTLYELQGTDREAFIGLNKTSCDQLGDYFQEELGFEETTLWKESDAHEIPAPACMKTNYQRDNHHGNGNGRNMIGYKWQVPENLIHEQCTIRLRYNISSTDYDGWNTDITQKIRDDRGCPCRNNYGVDVYSHYDMDGSEARDRGYSLRQDPRLKIFPDLDFRLRVALNTNQLGRTFEDRTHLLKFRALPDKVAKEVKKDGAKVFNLNGRGKIGNNVEVYPNFEMDFAPSRLKATVGDYVHIQFSGSNTNNFANDGSQVDERYETVNQARKLDRHNLIEIANMTSMHPDFDNFKDIFGWNFDDAMKLALDGIHGGNNEYLQAAGSTFDMGLMKLENKGTWRFMSTHNNRMGVRTQKGKIIVEETKVEV